MKNRFLLTALLTMLFVGFMTNVEAQCTKSKKSCSKSKTEQTKKSCNKSKSSCSKNYEYSSCSKYKKSSCDKSSKNSSSFNNLNTLVALGAVVFDNDNTNFATGIEYTRQVGNNVGLGLLSEVTFGDVNSVKIGIPVSYYFGRLKVSAAPMSAFNKKETTTIQPEGTGQVVTSTEMNLGARAAVSYMMNVKGLIIAPTVRADYLEDKLIPNIGINVGLGF